MFKLLCFFLLVLLNFTVKAEGITFNPVQLYMSEKTKQRSTTVTIESTGLDKAKIYELSAVKWSQNEKSEDVLEEDSNILFNPKTFELKPDGKQLIRVGFSQPVSNMDLRAEKTWRILFKEMTPMSKDESVNVLFNFSLPLFVGKQEKTNLNVGLNYINNELEINVVNLAKSHVKIVDVIVLDQENKELVKKDVNKYLLDGKATNIQLGAIDIKNKNNLKIKIKTDKDQDYQEYKVGV